MLERIIDKELDKYYAKKLAKELIDRLRPYFLEYYYVINKDIIDIYVNYVEENRKFKQDKKICTIENKNAFQNLFRITEIVETIKDRIDKTFK